MMRRNEKIGWGDGLFGRTVVILTAEWWMDHVAMAEDAAIGTASGAQYMYRKYIMRGICTCDRCVANKR